MSESIAGVRIPDGGIARDATELIRDTTLPLICHHSRRVFGFHRIDFVDVVKNSAWPE